jgi:alkylhydroperoxidase/carboxymuconolactone decarboxylase family protein YurZ
MQSLASIASSDTLPRDVTATPNTPVETRPSKSEARLQDLIPIAMVIVGGCEPCAEKMVTRALEQGSSLQDINRTLRIVANMQKQGCFAKAVGTDVVARMEKPLAAGWRTLQEAMTSAGK